MTSRRRKWALLGGATALVVVGAFLIHVLSMVAAGHGNVAYRNYRGQWSTPAVAAVTIALAMLCVAVAFSIAWWHRRRERKFDEIIAARRRNTVSGKDP